MTTEHFEEIISPCMCLLLGLIKDNVHTFLDLPEGKVWSSGLSSLKSKLPINSKIEYQ